ncbi:MAG: two-component sensor histidine kinase [Methylococcales bacterium]|nr:two-component sensor histidine kinase [Methylococcales bacterium]
MALNQPKTISPCLFSKGYNIPVEQAWSLLKVFFIYRFIIASFFVIILYSHFDFSSLKNQDTQLFYFTSQSYLIFSILSGVCVFKRLFGYTSQAQIAIFSDIIFITLLMHASGGINSGIGVLLVISIASGGLLIGGYCAIFFAALASIFIIAQQIYTHQAGSMGVTSFTYAGMLGASFFTIAYLSYVLAKRTEQSDILASQHQQTISNLEELNQYIIQHLQSGIIISTTDEKIKMCNEASLSICNKSDNVRQVNMLSDISKQLSDHFQHWIKDSSQNVALIKMSNQSEIHSRFSLLKTRLETFHMIILEDISLYNQRLQQNKLASLGCLTASIAHEIRNPLGAISHAGQLLSEAPNLTSQDQRLTEIIQEHCQRVNKIIEDILQLSRREPSKRTKINLNKWIRTYLHNFIQACDCGSNRFEIKSNLSDIWAHIDEGHLKQILDNLCSNALKYGNSKEKKIILEILVLEKSPCIRVIDNGKEVEPEISKHFFEPFFTTSPTGTGLGLYISKELAELNQAKLSYALVYSNKSCFTLCMPSVDNSKIEI